MHTCFSARIGPRHLSQAQVPVVLFPQEAEVLGDSLKSLVQCRFTSVFTDLQVKFKVKEVAWEKCLATWLPVLSPHLGIHFYIS